MTGARAAVPWSAGQYLKFEDERTRPARDLLAQVPLAEARLVVDLGCGPANSTSLLSARFPGARIIGIDSDPDMLAAARKRMPGVDFVAADIFEWRPEARTDLLYANAVFQWVPDHLSVLARLFQALSRGGVLAVQMPDNMEEPAQTLMRDVARAGPWCAALEPATRSRVALHPPGDYYDRLIGAAASVNVWHSHYQHPMADAAAILEWFKGSSLRPFLDALDAPSRAAFLADYEGRLAAAYPKRADARVLLRFPRLFIVAVRG